MTVLGLVLFALVTAPPSPYFGIHLVDEATGRGVPLVELTTVNDLQFVSDSAGWIAFREPELMGKEVYFAITSPGYEQAKDGFGFRGVRLTPAAGTTATVKIKRTNIAERLYRITGEGIYRDSELLDQPVPIKPASPCVLGQDSVQAVPYQGKLFWLWGDTNLANYPLGNFHTTCATSPWPGSDPDVGIPITYFADPKKPDRVRKMLPLTEPGPVWLFGLLAIPDDTGKVALLTHYTRRKSLAEEAEHGMARFDDASGEFKKLNQYELKNTWRFPRNNAVLDEGFFYFAAPFCHTRVKATWSALLDPDQYEAFVYDGTTGAYMWSRTAEPTTQVNERQLVKSGKIPSEKCRYSLTDAATGRAVTMHGASVNWNAFRKKWILVGVQGGDRETPSNLGEVWYAEADSITGPWTKAVKVASHPKYSFYNPRHHAFFDRDGGRVIYFEGTYTKTFSGNPVATPRYEYNQLMYRLDLADPRLRSTP